MSNWWTQNGFIDPIGSNIEEVRALFKDWDYTPEEGEEEEEDNNDD